MLVCLTGSLAFGGAPSAVQPRIQSLLKPEVFRRVQEDREIRTYARIEDPDAEGLKPYHFYAAMRARASVRRARETLTEYSLYQQMVPFVSRSEDRDGLLWIEGGIFGWRLASRVRIEPLSEGWLRYRIVSGHFAGMTGKILLETVGERETVVYFDGELKSRSWPPALILERGAEIVFGLTADRMRSLMEKRERDGVEKAGQNQGQIQTPVEVQNTGPAQSQGEAKAQSQSSGQAQSSLPQPQKGLKR